jgi:Right handed beta helix region
MHEQLPLVILTTALACALTAAPAYAQRARTFVASYGSDNGNSTCSFSQPCKTFQNAYNNTAVGGEVTAIDSAGFGPLFIQHSITITSPAGVEAGIVPSSGNDAIVILAGSSDVVVLRGLTLEGGGGLNGLEGISLAAAGTLEILDCVIKDFHDGVLVEPTSGTTYVTIKNTTVLNSGNAGIYFTPNGGSVSVNGTLDRVTTDRNQYGMYFDALHAGSGGMNLTINDSHAAENAVDGVVLIGDFSGLLSTSIKHTVLVANQNADLVLNSSGPFTVTQIIDYNEIDAVAGNGGISSDGTNAISQVGAAVTITTIPAR